MRYTGSCRGGEPRQPSHCGQKCLRCLQPCGDEQGMCGGKEGAVEGADLGPKEEGIAGTNPTPNTRDA